MPALGMTVRDIQAHLQEIYNVEVSPDRITKVSDAVINELVNAAEPTGRTGLSDRLHRRARHEDS
jgi:transposase-like protein